MILRDHRRERGQIWNVAQAVGRVARFGSPAAPWNSGAKVTDASWIDDFIYQGYKAHGHRFLHLLHGRYAVAVLDSEEQKMFVARDWIGEVPMHVLATATGFHVANTIADLRLHSGDEYSYSYVRAFPQSYCQEIDLRDVELDQVALTMRPQRPQLYLDFEEIIHDVEGELAARDAEHSTSQISLYLRDSIRHRLTTSAGRIAVLLSGGLDSFTIALALKALNVQFEAFTLSVDGGGSDLEMATEFAKRLDVPHHTISVRPEAAVEVFEEAVQASESYHLFNVYCAVGMLLIGRHLRDLDIGVAFCGEAVNEALGDYRDWILKDPAGGEPILLQHVDHERLERTPERTLYVWGQPSDRGKYNRQLGTGLAKHAGARMFKPFAHIGVTLECPYYERWLLARLIAIPPEVLNGIGGKPGLMIKAFAHELKRFKIDEELIMNCKKVRLQDASEGGEGGLSPVLLEAGCDQRRAIEIFNRMFGSTLDPVLDTKRLSVSS